MQTLVMLVFLVGGCLWIYRQWKELRKPTDGQAIIVSPGQATAEQWEVLNQPKPKARVNKYVVLALCVLYILCPLDILPDFIPVLGWGDDVTAAVIGLRALFKS